MSGPGGERASSRNAHTPQCYSTAGVSSLTAIDDRLTEGKKRKFTEAFNCWFKPWAPKSREGAVHHTLWDMNSPFSQDSPDHPVLY